MTILEQYGADSFRFPSPHPMGRGIKGEGLTLPLHFTTHSAS
jgi:hypothetical protein